MGDQGRESEVDSPDDLFDPFVGDPGEVGFEELQDGGSERQRLLAKRRRAERRLEERRLREELGDYDLHFDDL